MAVWRARRKPCAPRRDRSPRQPLGLRNSHCQAGGVMHSETLAQVIAERDLCRRSDGSHPPPHQLRELSAHPSKRVVTELDASVARRERPFSPTIWSSSVQMSVQSQRAASWAAPWISGTWCELALSMRKRQWVRFATVPGPLRRVIGGCGKAVPPATMRVRPRAESPYPQALTDQ
jgi:hypothetical protein